MHVSQSRLWEKHVGRSRRFWELQFSEFRDHFPDQLADATADDVWRAVNRVRPGFIRVEVDELTDDLHIILRSEIEATLMAGDLAVADLPAVWAEKMRDYLGLDEPDDTQGVLKDVNWSHGYVGSFSTYTLGNIMSSPFLTRAQQKPTVAAGLDTGVYAPLRGWLVENIYRHGRASMPTETLQGVTGKRLDPAVYIAGLTAEVDALCG